MCIVYAVMIVSLFRNLDELPGRHLSIISFVETCNIFLRYDHIVWEWITESHIHIFLCDTVELEIKSVHVSSSQLNKLWTNYDLFRSLYLNTSKFNYEA